MKEKIAVLGGGNGSFAAAADFALQGCEVRLWSKFPEELSAVRETGTITVSGPTLRGEARIALVTDDISEAVRGVEVILSILPAFTQIPIAESLAPCLEDGQVVYLPPGTFGSYIMYRKFREMGCGKDIAVAETGTNPYLTRKIDAHEVRIVVRACHLPTGVFPAKKTDDAVGKIQGFFPSAHAIEDALSGALMNAGPVIHPPLIVLNTGPIEHPSAYDIHNEGTTPGIRKVISLLDGERIRVREGFDYQPNHYPLEDYYDETRPNEWMYPRESKRLLMASHLWSENIDYSHRYVTEDIAYGLAFLVSAAAYAGVDVPVARSLLTIAGVVAGTDFMKTGRTFDALGLSGLSMKQLKNLLMEGTQS
ncbi:MAG TPA: NAD/NADP octopine/nopaline dehydrogenase family protein [Syntrophorhabdales bacterium]|nr:NAD/NADP octopine/nopaline dehydrogenase family protein [Syntrophorhabdales bacterium]